MRRFFPLLVVVIVLIGCIVPVSAADFVTDGTDANFYYSVFPVDYLNIFGSETESTDWLVNVPYPGSVRLNPYQFDSDSDFFFSYQVSGTGPNVIDSRVNFRYNPFYEVDLDFGTYQTTYELSSVVGAEAISYHWGTIGLHSDSFITRASVLKNREMPSIRLWWPSTEQFDGDEFIRANVECLVSWYEEVEGEYGSEYYLRYAEVNQSLEVPIIGLSTDEYSFTYLWESVPALAGVSSDALVAIDDFTLSLDISDFAVDGIRVDITDYYASAKYSSLQFMPWTNQRPIQNYDFWSWLTPSLSSFMETPFIFGWSISDLFSVIFVVIFMLIVLKFFAGG